jgi:hypothetical protein
MHVPVEKGSSAHKDTAQRGEMRHAGLCGHVCGSGDILWFYGFDRRIRFCRDYGEPSMVIHFPLDK